MEWEVVIETEATHTARLKVDGGFLYHRCDFVGNFDDGDFRETTTMCFVPDVDLQRYQAHLRDAYHQGYHAGQEDAKNGISDEC